MLGQRAQLLTLDGETDRAIEALEQVLALAPEIGSGDEVLITHLRLAGLEVRRGRPVAAREHVRLMRQPGRNSSTERERGLLCDSVEASVLLAEGRTGEASDFVAGVRDKIDDSLLANRFSAHASSMALASCAYVELTLARLDDHDAGPESRPRIRQAIADLRRGYAAALATEDVPILSEFAAVAAVAADAVGDPERATRLLGGSAGMVGLDRLGDPRQVELADRLRTELGSKTFDELFAAGRGLERAEVVALMDPSMLVAP